MKDMENKTNQNTAQWKKTKKEYEITCRQGTTFQIIGQKNIKNSETHYSKVCKIITAKKSNLRYTSNTIDTSTNHTHNIIKTKYNTT